MATYPIASLAHRGRGVLSQSAVLHVLRLVHSGHVVRGSKTMVGFESSASKLTPRLKSPRRFVRYECIGGILLPLMRCKRMNEGRLRVSRPYHFVGLTSDPAGPSRPSRSESTAAQKDRHQASRGPHPPLNPAEPTPTEPPSQLRRTSLYVPPPFSNVRQDFIDSICNEDTIRLPHGETTSKPSEFATQLLDGRGWNRAQIRRGLEATDFTHIDVIRTLFVRSLSASYPHWAWLANKLVEVIDLVHKQQLSADPALAPLLHAFVAYCLLQEPPKSTSKATDQRLELARIALDKSVKSRRSLSPRLPSLPIEHSIRALSYTLLGQWTQAQDEAFRAVPYHIARRPYHSADVQCLEKYREFVSQAQRPSDFFEIIVSRFRSLLPIFIWETAYRHPRRELADVFFRAIASLQDPAAWYDEQLKEPSTKTRWLGSLLFIALVRWPDHADKALAIFDRLVANRFWVSGHHAADLCLHLTVLKRNNDVLAVFSAYFTREPQPSTSVCRRFMNLLAANGWLAQAAALQQSLISRKALTPRDRSAIALAHAQLGDVRGTVANLRKIYDKDMLVDFTSLRALLLAYINSDNVSGVRKILEAIMALSPNSMLFNTALRYYASRGEALHALQIYEQFTQAGGTPTIHTYTALVHLFGRQGDFASLQRIIQLAVDAGVEIDGPFCAEILDSCSHVGDWAGLASRMSVLPTEIKRHPHVATAILKAFVFMAVPFNVVQKLFSSIDRPTIQQWSLLIMAACDNGDLEKARGFLDEMDRRSKVDTQNPAPNSFTFSILLHGHLRKYQKMRARAVFDEMMERKLIPSSITYGMIITSFLRVQGGGYLDQAHRFAMSIRTKATQGELPERGADVSRINVNLFGQLIQAAGKMGRADNAQAYYEMATKDREPTARLSIQLMEAYRLAGDVDQVMLLWNQLYERAKRLVGATESTSATATRSNILCIPLSIALDALSSKGRFKEIRQVWDEVRTAGFGVDASNLQHYAIALARTGDLAGAFWIVDRLVLRQYDRIAHRKRKAWRSAKDKKGVNTRAMLYTEDEKAEQDSLRKYFIQEDRADETVYPKLEELIEYPGPLSASDIRSSFDPLSPPASQSAIGRQTLHKAQQARKERVLPDDVDEYTQMILQSWRPSDHLWRPSLMLKMVLSHAYGQIQLRKRQLEVLLRPSDLLQEQEATSNEDLKEAYSKPHVVTLTLFNNCPVRDKEGEPILTTPRAILWRLNRLFPRVVVMIHRYRARKAGRRYDGAIRMFQAARRREQSRRKHFELVEKYRRKSSGGKYETSPLRRENETARRVAWRLRRQEEYVLPDENKVAEEKRPRFGMRYPTQPDYITSERWKTWGRLNYRHHGLSTQDIVRKRARLAREKAKEERRKKNRTERRRRYRHGRRARELAGIEEENKAKEDVAGVQEEAAPAEVYNDPLLKPIPPHLVRRFEEEHEVVEEEKPTLPKGW